MSQHPHLDWIKTDPIANAIMDGFGRTPWRKGDFPTTISRDGNYLYLASMDLVAPLDETGYLLRLFNDAYNNLQREIDAMGWSCRRAALIETDYLALWDALRDADALPDDYRFPEYHLELAWRKRKPTAVFHTRDVPIKADA